MHKKFCLRGGIKSDGKIEETSGKDDRMAYDCNFDFDYYADWRGDVCGERDVVCFGSYIA